ncbi:unnamed protein product [Paramecium octaurelia]|uniref:Uncharacterized protein n=1 Tax=Paramecium octaurelia TaxID=43137 RepID=A0A8S1XQR9_PAROT|nr:unnamed protein product [Paramecium octaurelia]
MSKRILKFQQTWNLQFGLIFKECVIDQISIRGVGNLQK